MKEATGNRLENFSQFAHHASVEELVQIVRKSISKPDATKVLDDLLQAIPDSEAGQLKRRKLFECCLKILEKARVSQGHANAIINRMISDLPRFSKQHLLKIVDLCLANICPEDNELHSWKDLLPVLLETLENEAYIVHENAEVSGAEYKSLIIKAICALQWNIDLLPSLAKMFGDMTLDKLERNQVFQTLCSSLPDLSMDRVPSFVYQTLKLCKDQDNRRLLDALSKYFDACYTRTLSDSDKDSFESICTVNVKEVRDTESTVLYHLYQAAQLNHESMKDFIRFLKQVSYAPEFTLQPFMLAVLMSISSIYEDQIFEISRTAIANNTLEEDKRHRSGWLRQLLPSSRNVTGIIRQVIDCSSKDRHLVLRGLTNFSFMLMSADHKTKSNATVMWTIGSEVVREIMKKRHETVPIVLQEIISRIIGGNTPTTHYTDCLTYACRELAMIVLDHQAWIMTLLERLLFLPSNVADGALRAILPLMHVSPNIRENLLLTLRKALYRKGIAKRQVAVTGFLEMLKYSKLHSLGNFRLSQRYNSSGRTTGSGSSSALTQVTMELNSQREKRFTESDKTLCFEILEILKKTFTYESQVRLHMYEGLYDTVMKNSAITEVVLDMLLSHFDLYFVADENALPPVEFEQCFDTSGVDVLLQEPIGQLIFLLQKISVNAPLKNSVVLDRLRNTFESLCRRMTIMDLKHISLEQGADLVHGDSTKSQSKMKKLDMAIATYEALMALHIGECSKGNEESVHKIHDLFKAYTRFVDFIRAQSGRTKKPPDGGKTSKGDKDANNKTKKHARSQNVKMPNTIMDLDAIRQGLSLLYSGNPASTESERALQENHTFGRYILHACEQLLQRANPDIKDTLETRFKNCYSLYTEIGGLLYHYFVLRLKDALASDKQATIVALRCFKEISSRICTFVPSELTRFLGSILRAKRTSTSADLNSHLEEIIFSVKPHLRAMLAEEVDDDDKKYQLSFLLLQIVELFALQINFQTYDHGKILECIKEIIQTEEIQSSIVAAVVRFFLILEERSENDGETLNEICLELCEKAGSIDGSEVAATTVTGQYKIIREDTILQVYDALNGQIKEKLSNASWLLMRLKAEDAVARASGTMDQHGNDRSREKEKNLCRQLSKVAQVLLTIANTSVKPGPQTDVTLKNLQSLYHILGLLAKYFYAKSNDQTAAFQAVKFIQLVQLAGKPLKTAFYNLVTHVEENQNGSDPKSDSYAKRRKILKETKVIPRVVYEIEQFNKEVLLLGKRTCVPLENYMKHSVTRDFRIKNPQLVEDLEKMDLSTLDSTHADDIGNESRDISVDETGDHSDDTTPSRKRSRTDD